MLKSTDFSKLSHADAIARLERVQAIFTRMADSAVMEMNADILTAAESGSTKPRDAFRDGALTVACKVLDCLQAQEAGTNLRGRMISVEK